MYYPEQQSVYLPGVEPQRHPLFQGPERNVNIAEWIAMNREPQTIKCLKKRGIQEPASAKDAAGFLNDVITKEGVGVFDELLETASFPTQGKSSCGCGCGGSKSSYSNFNGSGNNNDNTDTDVIGGIIKQWKEKSNTAIVDEIGRLQQKANTVGLSGLERAKLDLLKGIIAEKEDQKPKINFLMVGVYTLAAIGIYKIISK